MNKFRIIGTVSVKHINARKEGQDDDKKLAVDLKFGARVDERVFHFFNDCMPDALWLPGTGAVRNLSMGPIPFNTEHEGYRLECLGAVHNGVKVKKFSMAALDGRHIDLVFSVSFDPEGNDVAILAEHLQEDFQIILQPDTAELPFDGEGFDDGVWCVTVQPAQPAPPDHMGPTDSDLLAGMDGDDPLLEQAKDIVIAQGKASISLIQRHLQIGYNRAARLLESLESLGYVSAMDNTGARTVIDGVTS
jgi:hypothetical protein